jgi:DNA-binding CsgD family transcriptional regulator/N-acetylneuraminic acid mutarotase
VITIKYDGVGYNFDMQENLSSLSERELEILRLLAGGCSNKQIAQQLGISPNTVKVHLRNIFEKLGLASRTEAALFAVRAGLAETPEPAPAVERRKPRLLLGLLILIVFPLLGWAVWAAAGQRQPPATAAPAAPVATSRWQVLNELPLASGGMAGVVYENSLVFICGETPHSVSGSLTRFDLSTGAWQALAAKPLPVSRAQAAVLGDLIYVAGGLTAAGDPTASLEVYLPRVDRWELRAPLPEALAGASLAAFEGFLYLFGGWNGQKDSAAVYRYDPQADTWQPMTGLPSSRSYTSTVVVENKILVMGGLQGQHVLDETWAYYPQRDQLGETPWEAKAALPAPRYAAGGAALAGQVYLAGGFTTPDQTTAQPVLLMYRPVEDQWLAGEAPPVEPGGWSCLLAARENLYLLGGFLYGRPISLHLSYQAIYSQLLPLVQ